MRICVSVGAIALSRLADLLAHERLVELRLDMLPFDENVRQLIRSAKAEVIATVRASSGASISARKEVMISAIRAGVSYVDIDKADAAEEWRDVVQYAHAERRQVIISCHHFDETPRRENLACEIDNCFALGADIAKIACMVRRKLDSATLLGLLADERPLIMVGMGEEGRWTRIIAPLVGGFATYAYPDGENPTAPGQYSASELRALYGCLGVSE